MSKNRGAAGLGPFDSLAVGELAQGRLQNRKAPWARVCTADGQSSPLSASLVCGVRSSEIGRAKGTKVLKRESLELEDLNGIRTSNRGTSGAFRPPRRNVVSPGLRLPTLTPWPFLAREEWPPGLGAVAIAEFGRPTIRQHRRSTPPPRLGRATMVSKQCGAHRRE